MKCEGSQRGGMVMVSSIGFSDVEIRETHRVHDQAGSAIIRATIPE